MAPVEYVAEDALGGHQKKDRPLVLRFPSIGECQDREAGVGSLVNRERRMGYRVMCVVGP